MSQVLFDVMLMSTARHYDLTSPAGRALAGKDIFDFFIDLNRYIEPEVVYEIGAFNPRFSVEIKKILPQVQAFAFEASPYNYAFFKNDAIIVSSGVDYRYGAISDRTGEADFLVQRKLRGETVDVIRENNSLLARTEADVEYEAVRVPTTTLTDFAEQNDLQRKRFTAWIDVEGAAQAVLMGGGDLWRDCAALMIEVEQHSYWKGQWRCWDVMDYLMQSGFIPVARDFEADHQFNMIYIKQELLRNPGVRVALVNRYSSFVKPRA